MNIICVLIDSVFSVLYLLLGRCKRKLFFYMLYIVFNVSSLIVLVDARNTQYASANICRYLSGHDDGFISDGGKRLQPTIHWLLHRPGQTTRFWKVTWIKNLVLQKYRISCTKKSSYYSTYQNRTIQSSCAYFTYVSQGREGALTTIIGFQTNACRV
jgi:hypothetical protein